MIPGIALIVGNGLTKNLLERSGNPSLDSSRPLSLQFDVPFCSGMPWQAAFPLLASSLSEVMGSQPEIRDFDVFNALLTSSHPIMLDDQMRQYLAFAYSSLQAEMDLLDKEATPWTDWLRSHRYFLRAVISFNYDLLLEDLLSHTGIITKSPGVRITFNIKEDLRSMRITRDRSRLLLLKPHGSIGFAHHPRAVSMPTRTYPSTNVVTLNNTPLIRIPRNRLGCPRQEAYIVLPTEYSPYRGFQWVRPGYMEFARIANSITHCVFLGLSYWECDRAELNFILDVLPSTTVIVEANPFPPADFRSYVESSGRHYVHWEGDPLDISSTHM